MVHSDIRDYQVTLVPENSETEVALILMHIQLASNDVYGDNSSLVTPVMQFLWLLNVMRTVYEGLLPGVDEADISWEPEPAFARIHDELVTELHERASDETDAVIAEFRMITEELHSREIADKENILEMLYNLTSNLGLEQITDFLKAEIDMPGAMGHN